MRILALDVGERRTGVAVSDPTGTLASPLTVLHRTGAKADYVQILKLADEQQAERIVIGLPVSMNGKLHGQARIVQRFAAALQALTKLPVELCDERLTTVEAERRMQEAGSSAAHRKEHRDSAAAAVLLQSYLDSRRPPE